MDMTSNLAATRDVSGEGTHNSVLKRRRKEVDLDANGTESPANDDSGKQQTVKKAKTRGGFPCPFRKRNPLRFNVRDYQKCALWIPNMRSLK